PIVVSAILIPLLTTLPSCGRRDEAVTPLRPRGVDISYWQGRVDWRAVEAAGISFVYLRATEGTTVVDSTFRPHWAALGETRILRGASHRFRPAGDAAAQAEHFLSVAAPRKGDLPPMLDIEAVDDVPEERLVHGVRTWLRIVEQRTGVRPIVQTLPADSTVIDYPLWIAEYGVQAPSVEKWVFWQHSQRGRVPGIENVVDLDWFNGTDAELRRLAIGSAPAKPVAER
ncbi:MAG TPA: GH25 family lysozyme, partial [Longimicrobium sp.]